MEQSSDALLTPVLSWSYAVAWHRTEPGLGGGAAEGLQYKNLEVSSQAGELTKRLNIVICCGVMAL